MARQTGFSAVTIIMCFIFLVIVTTCETVKKPRPPEKDPEPKEKAVEKPEPKKKPAKKEEPPKPAKVKKVIDLGRRLYQAIKTRNREKAMRLFPPFEALSRTLEEEDIVEYSMKDYPKMKRRYRKAFTKLSHNIDFSTSTYVGFEKGRAEKRSKMIVFFHNNTLTYKTDAGRRTVDIPVILFMDGYYYIPILYKGAVKK